MHTINNEVINAIRTLIDKARWLDDEGPIGEDWQYELANAIYILEDWLEELKK